MVSIMAPASPSSPSGVKAAMVCAAKMPPCSGTHTGNLIEQNEMAAADSPPVWKSRTRLAYPQRARHEREVQAMRCRNCHTVMMDTDPECPSCHASAASATAPPPGPMSNNPSGLLMTLPIFGGAIGGAIYGAITASQAEATS